MSKLQKFQTVDTDFSPGDNDNAFANRDCNNRGFRPLTRFLSW